LPSINIHSRFPPHLADLARLGQTTQVARSTLEQVRAHIAYLRSSTSEKVTSKNFDFDARLNAIKAQEDSIRKEKRENKKRKREEARMNAMKGIVPDEPETETQRKKKAKAGVGAQLAQEIQATEAADEMAAMMGFRGFGGQRKR
jgi:U4/U6.U5 tri-snRNP component SNU23